MAALQQMVQEEAAADLNHVEGVVGRNQGHMTLWPSRRGEAPPCWRTGVEGWCTHYEATCQRS